MTVGFTAVFALVLGLTALAIFGPQGWRERFGREGWVYGLGIAFPVVVIGALLLWGFAILGADEALADAEDPVRIEVTGERWWWRVTYLTDDGRRVESANELRVPVGRTVELALKSADVIHSFWLPAYAGKTDMIPGRTNTLRFVADEAGRVRGQCAEYCGGAHAFMAFWVEAMPEAAFEDWLEHEAGPPPETSFPDGETVFLSSGCGGCHAVRGTPGASGEIGPNLSHVGSRTSLGAGIMPNDREAFVRWVADHQEIKPENNMPPYDILNDEELAALGAYLEGLQ
nr:c-type cytochrome [Parvularcula dongshanensis]